MDEKLKDAIHQQRTVLAERLREPLWRLADKAIPVWGQREKLDSVLTEGFDTIPCAMFLYALDRNGIQISDNVGTGGLLPEHYGRDRSQRPYMKEAVPASGFLLSDAYISQRGNRPSLTALQLVRQDGEAGAGGGGRPGRAAARRGR